MALFFPAMFTKFVEHTSMKVPENPDGDWDDRDFPHFSVYVSIHIGRPLRGDWHSQLKHNAEIIAKLSDEEITKVTLGNLVDKGLIL